MLYLKNPRKKSQSMEAISVVVMPTTSVLIRRRDLNGFQLETTSFLDPILSTANTHITEVIKSESIRVFHSGINFIPDIQAATWRAITRNTANIDKDTSVFGILELERCGT
jgi:hypothetical protein